MKDKSKLGDDTHTKINGGQSYILWIFKASVGEHSSTRVVMDHTADGNWLRPHMHLA